MNTLYSLLDMTIVGFDQEKLDLCNIFFNGKS